MTDAELMTKLIDNTGRIVELIDSLTKSIGDPKSWFIADEIEELSVENERIRHEYARRLSNGN